MANSCTVGEFSQKSFPSARGFITPPYLDRQYYAELLTNMFTEQIETMSTLLEGFAINELIPAFSDITYEYPDTSKFATLRPKPLDIIIETPEPKPVKPKFIEIEEPPPPNIPVWTLGDLEINIPNIPDPSIPEFSKDAPPITYPTMPDPMEELRDIDLPIITPISIPDWMEVEFPILDAELAEVDLVEPGLVITPGDNLYISRVKDAVEAAVYDMVIHGGTGLAPEVEEAIFQRESERALKAHNDQLIKIRADWLKGHYPLPTSMLYAMINESEMDYTNKRLDTSRDISIKQAELAQANTHFYIEKALAYEQMLIGWFNNIAQRTFEASKATQDASIEIYKASLQKYNILLDVYKAKVQIYEVTANVAIKKLEAIKIKLEAAKTTAEINRINVEIYKTQVEALRIFIEQYQAELAAAKTYLEAENLKLTAYKTEVEAYGIRVNAATAYYNMFNTRIEGEKAKVQAYGAGADAFGKRVQAEKLAVDADTAFINAQSEINKSLATVYTSEASVFKTLVDAEVAEAEGKVKIYEGQIKGYETEAKVLDIIGNLQINKVKTQLEEYKVEFQSQLEIAKMKIQETLEEWKMRFQVLETMAQVIAQVTSAALNSDAITTHMSESYSYGEQKQASCTDQHYYDDTTV